MVSINAVAHFVVLNKNEKKLLIYHYIQYRKNHKFWGKKAQANSPVPDQTAPVQSDQGLHCLPPLLHLLAAELYAKITLFKF